MKPFDFVFPGEITEVSFKKKSLDCAQDDIQLEILFVYSWLYKKQKAPDHSDAF